MSTRFYVGGISPSVTKDDLEKLFSRLAPVEEVHSPHAVVPALSRHFMIVRLKDGTDSKSLAAVSKLNGSVWKGGKLRIEPAKPFFKERLAEEKRIETEKESAPKLTVPKFNKKSPIILASLVPDLEKGLLPPRPNYLRVRRARCRPAMRITQPLLLVNEKCYKVKDLEVDERSRFGKHIIFDDDQVQSMIRQDLYEPFTPEFKQKPSTSTTSKDVSKSKTKIVDVDAKKNGKGEAVEIVKKTGQRKGFGTLLVAADSAAATGKSNEIKRAGAGSNNGTRLSQVSENEMDLDDDEDDDEIVRRFPMPQSNVEYAFADMSTGKTKVMSEEEMTADRQRMLQFAMMQLISPPPAVPVKDKSNKSNVVKDFKQEGKTGVTEMQESRKRARSDLSEGSADSIPKKGALSKGASPEKHVHFKSEGLEEIHEISNNNDKNVAAAKPRLDEAVRKIFGSANTTQITPKENESSKSIPIIEVESSSNNVPSGYADMSTLKSIFDSGEQGGIWWDDNVGKAVASAAEERGQGFQNDEIFRAAEKYGIDVRMFDFANADVAVPSSVGSHTGVLAGETNAASESAMVFDFFGDGGSVTTGNVEDSATSGQTTTSSSIKATPIQGSQDPAQRSLANVYAMLNDQLYDTILAGAKRFQRNRSEEDVQHEWERNKQRLFSIVTKKARVSKKQAATSSKSNFHKNASRKNLYRASSSKK